VFRTGTPNNRTERGFGGERINKEANEDMSIICIMAWKDLLLHLFGDLLVNRVTEILYATFTPSENNGLRVIWSESPWFCVNADKIQCFPHLLDQLVDVEPVSRRYWHGMRNFITVIQS
jgi:hypothetical protein